MAAQLGTQFEKIDAALDLAAHKLEGEFAAEWSGEDARLNPMRLLKRLSAIEAELPKLRATAEANAEARRRILGELSSTLASNQEEALRIARLAAAPVADDAAAWTVCQEQQLAPALERCQVGTGPAPAAATAPPTAQDADDAAPSADAAALAAATPPDAAPPDAAPPAASPAAISELQWLRLGAEARGGVSSLDELNEFWRTLHGHFMRREATTLKAAQLLALGVRMTGASSKKPHVLLLEKLGLLTLQNNSLALR